MDLRRIFGDQVARARERRGYSLRTLSDAVAEITGGDRLGLDHARLSRIEHGRTDVTIQQWLALAAALDSPPLLLIAPVGSASDVELVPGTVGHPDLWMQWIEGDEAFFNSEQIARDLRQFHRMAAPLRLYRELRHALRALDDDQPYRPSQSSTLVEQHAALADVLARMIDADVTPPELSPWRLGRLAEFGHDPDALGLEPFVPDWLFDGRGEDRVVMEHLRLKGVFEVPLGWVEGMASAGWREVGP